MDEAGNNAYDEIRQQLESVIPEILARILEEPPRVEKGMLVLPQHPGTGVRLDERAVKQYTVG